ESDYRTGGNRYFLTGLGVAPRTLVLAPQVEIAEAGQLHLTSLFQCIAQHIEKRVDKFLGLTFVQSYLVEQPVSHLRLGQCHACPCLPPQLRIFAPCSRSIAATTPVTTSSTSRSVRVRDLSCKIKPIARLLKPGSTPLPT